MMLSVQEVKGLCLSDEVTIICESIIYTIVALLNMS